MNIHVVYAHPEGPSFCGEICNAFLHGLADAGHRYTLSDLYAMGFKTDMSAEEYDREANYRRELPVPQDVAAEQENINASDGIAFIYPVFWTDAPAKLKGWFDRVWTFGFAYGDGRTMKTLQKALFLANAGNTVEYLRETGFGEAMKSVMLRDRIFDRALEKEMLFFDGTSRDQPELLAANRERHLQAAYRAGLEF